MYYYEPPKFCYCCGTKYVYRSAAAPEAINVRGAWPVVCQNADCNPGRRPTEVYSNPTPVSVLLIPCGDGLLGVRRNIDPGIGQLAFPGGHHNADESWDEAASREGVEETGVVIPVSEIEVFNVLTGNGKHQLTFGLANVHLDALPPFDPIACHETQELVLLTPESVLCFPTHQETMLKYFARREKLLRLNTALHDLAFELSLHR